METEKKDNLKPTKGKTMLEDLVSQRAKLALEKSGVSQAEIAKVLGVEQPTASRLFTGKTAWKLNYLQKFAEHIGERVENLLGADVYLPVNVLLEDCTGFDYELCRAPVKKQGEKYGMAIIPPDLKDLDDLYVIKIGTDKFKPFLRKNAICYVQRHSGHLIQDCDFAVSIDDMGQARLVHVQIKGKTLVLNTFCEEGEVEKSTEHKRMLDRVVWIKP